MIQYLSSRTQSGLSVHSENTAVTPAMIPLTIAPANISRSQKKFPETLGFVSVILGPLFNAIPLTSVCNPLLTHEFGIRLLLSKLSHRHSGNPLAVSIQRVIYVKFANFIGKEIRGLNLNDTFPRPLFAILNISAWFEIRR